MELKIVLISDTHGLHRRMTHEIPECDILIHSGDYTNRGEKYQVNDFFNWLKEQRQATYKIFIEGNHDVHADPKFMGETNSHMWFETMLKEHNINTENGDIFRLMNSSINLLGLSIWGSPITPDFFPEHWAFNKTRGQAIKEVWDLIPIGTDIVVTHGPCEHKLDYIDYQKKFVGCADLDYRIQEIKPIIHTCGHIHCARGVEETLITTYVNSSICTESYKPSEKPYLLKINI